MNALDMLKKVKTQKISFKKHPCKDLELEEKVHYLNGLALVIGIDGDVSKKEEEYLASLIASFDLEKNIIEDFVEFAKKPDSERVEEMIEVLISNDIKYNFLVDAMMIASADGNYDENEKAIVQQYYEMFEIGNQKQKELEQIFELFDNKDAIEIHIYFSRKSSIRQERFEYLFDFLGIESKLEEIRELDRKEQAIQTNLATMLKKISISYRNYGLLIDKNGKVKSFSMDRWGNSNYMGVGKEDTEGGRFYDILDLPKELKCISVSSRYDYSMVLMEDDSIYSWGNSRYGQLGDGTEEDRLSAFKVKGLPKDVKPIKIETGPETSFVLLENGDLYASGEIVNSLVFVKYPLEFKISDFELMCDTSYEIGLVLLDENSQIFVKKIRDRDIEWLNCKENECVVPEGFPEDVEIKQVEAGSGNIYILTKNNEVYSVGNNDDGQLGLDERGKFISSFSKVYGIKGEIKSICTVKESSLSGGKYTSWMYECGSENNFVVAITDQSCYGWGDNSKLQLGEKNKYYETYYETGKIFKDTHWTKHYYESNPKEIEKLKQVLKKESKKIIVCNGGKVFIYNYDMETVEIFRGNEDDMTVLEVV